MVAAYRSCSKSNHFSPSLGVPVKLASPGCIVIGAGSFMWALIIIISSETGTPYASKVVHTGLLVQPVSNTDPPSGPWFGIQSVHITT